MFLNYTNFDMSICIDYITSKVLVPTIAYTVYDTLFHLIETLACHKYASKVVYIEYCAYHNIFMLCTNIDYISFMTVELV